MVIYNIKQALSSVTAVGRGIFMTITNIFTGINYSVAWNPSYVSAGSDGFKSYFYPKFQSLKSQVVLNADVAMPLTSYEVFALQEELERLRELVTLDELTGLNNRRAFFKHAEGHFSDLRRFELKRDRLDIDLRRDVDQAVLIYIDLYDFSAINNNLGHQAGDEALKIISQVLTKMARSTDFPARIGGDEFAILASNSSLENANILVLRLKTAFDDLSMNWDGQKIKLIATIGMSVVDTELSVKDNLDLADKSMYLEKERQRQEYPKAETIDELLGRDSDNISYAVPQIREQMPLKFS